MESRMIVVCALTLGAGSVATAGTLAFTDQSAPAGIAALQIPCCYPFATHMVGGGAVGDFNRDGLQDMYIIVGGNQPDRLYMNNGDGTFTDQAAAAGMGGSSQFSAGVAVGDYNNDGWLDIYVTCFGSQATGWSAGAHRLWRNNGDDTFTDVASFAQVETTSAFIGDGFSAAFGDYDLDGDLDLAVTGWVTNSGGNRLFRNDGGGFVDVTGPGLPAMGSVRGFSPRFTDMDGDRYPELLWVGDFFTSRYLRNNTDGTFSDLTASAGVGLDSNGMGNATGDFNNDGLIDWYVSSILEDGHPFRFGNMLYMNQGGHVFNEVGAAAGVDDGGWGWGTLAADFDHDMLLDIAEVNGWPDSPEWIGESSKLFMNNGDGTFASEAASTGFTHTGMGRGLVRLDYDNDGDQDLAVFGAVETASLYRNDLSGSDANWLRLFFDTSAHADLAPDGFGTRAQVTAGGVTQTRYLDGGATYLAVSELSMHFGLADAAVIDEIRIEWSNGRVNRHLNVTPNQTMTIVPCFLAGDVNDDLTVNFDDLNTVLNNWGETVAPFTDGDADGDGDVDFDDINTVLGAWSQNCA